MFTVAGKQSVGDLTSPMFSNVFSCSFHSVGFGRLGGYPAVVEISGYFSERPFHQSPFASNAPHMSDMSAVGCQHEVASVELDLALDYVSSAEADAWLFLGTKKNIKEKTVESKSLYFKSNTETFSVALTFYFFVSTDLLYRCLSLELERPCGIVRLRSRNNITGSCKIATFSFPFIYKF